MVSFYMSFGCFPFFYRQMCYSCLYADWMKTGIWIVLAVINISTTVQAQSPATDFTTCINNAETQYTGSASFIQNYTGGIVFLGWGGGGGGGQKGQAAAGGPGAYAAYVVNVTQGTNYTVEVGGPGLSVANNPGTGGTDGGGAGGGGAQSGGGGGGATALIRFNPASGTYTYLASIAGGGGGGGCNQAGFAAGAGGPGGCSTGTAGGTGSGLVSTCGGGTGGTSTQGGYFGNCTLGGTTGTSGGILTGGAGGTGSNSGGGGGGAGEFGGGGGPGAGTAVCSGGGGGGSSGCSGGNCTQIDCATGSLGTVTAPGTTSPYYSDSFGNAGAANNHDGVGGLAWILQCRTYYNGDGCNCQPINYCASNPCQNGATCNQFVGLYTCTCAAGFSGLQCQTDINECASTPCVNGGTCVDHVNSFTCNCVPGYSGLQCQTNINECSSTPCQNGGTCTDN